MMRPVQRRKLYEEVALRIEEMIREQRLAAGDRLPAEREIMATLGVGRSAVREAMLSLQKMGLVQVSSGERAQVRAPSAKAMVGELSGAARMLLAQPGGMQQFQDARALFEIGLARLAAERATDADIAALAEALEANRLTMGDPVAFSRTDVAFHYCLARIARNPIFTAICEAVAEWLTEQRSTSGKAPQSSKYAYAAHKRIYEAVAARDPAAAQAAMQRHLDTVAKLYWKVRSTETAGADA